MNERDSSERFDRTWEEKKRGVKSDSQELTEPISQALETAERISPGGLFQREPCPRELAPEATGREPRKTRPEACEPGAVGLLASCGWSGVRHYYDCRICLVDS